MIENWAQSVINIFYFNDSLRQSISQSVNQILKQRTQPLVLDKTYLIRIKNWIFKNYSVKRYTMSLSLFSAQPKDIISH